MFFRYRYFQRNKNIKFISFFFYRYEKWTVRGNFLCKKLGGSHHQTSAKTTESRTPGVLVLQEPRVMDATTRWCTISITPSLSGLLSVPYKLVGIVVYQCFARNQKKSLYL
jgi:hypothetical protein